jgi:hypothetical protein
MSRIDFALPIVSTAKVQDLLDTQAAVLDAIAAVERRVHDRADLLCLVAVGFLHTREIAIAMPGG